MHNAELLEPLPNAGCAERKSRCGHGSNCEVLDMIWAPGRIEFRPIIVYRRLLIEAGLCISCRNPKRGMLAGLTLDPCYKAYQAATVQSVQT